MNKSIYSKEYKALVTRLKDARLKIGLTQGDVAKRLKKPQSYISKIENGEQRIDVIEMKKFADLYKKDINYFL
ncbi:MAG: helix-turn-helix transcriptional regulator [Patescibacteria group bacterium]|jgi:transcriptional regulator with XRE-family HTH domain|nr:helix-turn-helix transcriptional regulator [Patescibacteria group bacterium]